MKYRLYVLIMMLAITGCADDNNNDIPVNEPENLKQHLLRHIKFKQLDFDTRQPVDYDYLVIDTNGCSDKYYNAADLGFTQPAMMDTLASLSNKQVRTQQWYEAQLDSIANITTDRNTVDSLQKAFKLKTLRYQVCLQVIRNNFVGTGEYYCQGNGDSLSLIREFIWGKNFANYHWTELNHSGEKRRHKPDSL